MKIHWHKATGFVREESKETSQQPLIPDNYYLPQCELDSTIASSHNDETRATNDDSMLILPQGKTGSMTDAQHTTHAHTNIGGDNESTLDCHLTAESSDTNNQQLNHPQQDAAFNMPGNSQGMEPMTTQTHTRIIRPPE